MLAQYVGRYQIGPDFILAVTLEGGQLMTQATGQNKLEVFAESETRFFLKAVDAQLTFGKGRGRQGDARHPAPGRRGPQGAEDILTRYQSTTDPSSSS